MSDVDPKLGESKDRLVALAKELVEKHGARLASRMFQGTVLGILIGNFGLEDARQYLTAYAAVVSGKKPDDDWASWPEENIPHA